MTHDYKAALEDIRDHLSEANVSGADFMQVVERILNLVGLPVVEMETIEDLDEDWLDSMVHGALSDEASSINNEGKYAQVMALLERGYTLEELLLQHREAEDNRPVVATEGERYRERVRSAYMKASGNTVYDGRIWDSTGAFVDIYTHEAAVIYLTHADQLPERYEE